jgi:hypothetical protein
VNRILAWAAIGCCVALCGLVLWALAVATTVWLAVTVGALGCAVTAFGLSPASGWMEQRWQRRRPATGSMAALHLARNRQLDNLFDVHRDLFEQDMRANAGEDL